MSVTKNLWKIGRLELWILVSQILTVLFPMNFLAQIVPHFITLLAMSKSEIDQNTQRAKGHSIFVVLWGSLEFENSSYSTSMGLFFCQYYNYHPCETKFFKILWHYIFIHIYKDSIYFVRKIFCVTENSINYFQIYLKYKWLKTSFWALH